MNLSSAWVTRLECPKGVKDEVTQARRAKRVAEGHQLEIGAQRAPRFLVIHNFDITYYPKCNQHLLPFFHRGAGQFLETPVLFPTLLKNHCDFDSRHV